MMHLELEVNGRATGVIAPVRWRDGRLEAGVRALREAGLPVAGDDAAWTEPLALGDVQASPSDDGLRLRLVVPAGWLPMQQVRSGAQPEYAVAHSSRGLMFNYDGYASQARGGPLVQSLWHEWRAFGKAGVLSSTGVWRDGVRSERARDGFLRYDTQWRLSDPQRMVTYEAGDVITRGVSWSRAFRLGGVQVSRDFSVRPDVVTYPVPAFAGEATLPSTVELFLDGHRAMGGRLDPGPFNLSTVPGLSGAGVATVVTTDVLGRQVATQVPFYVSSELLAPGLVEFAAAAGALRRDYGLRSDAYGEPAGTASLRYGVRDWLTVEAHGEGAAPLSSAGAGAVLRLGTWGVADASYARSQWRGRTGRQVGMGYQYTASGFALNVSHWRRSSGYADLSVLDRSGAPARRNTVAAASVAVGETGTLGAAYFDAVDREGRRVRLANLSWSQPLAGRGSLFFSLNRELGRRGWSGTVQYVVSLGRGDRSASAGLDRTADGALAARAQYRRSVPGDGGIGWNIGYAHTADGALGDYLQADATWRGRPLQVQAGIYGDPSRPVGWALASGSVVAMGGALFASPRINDAFAVVDTGGHGGVPVRYENQPVGTTNAAGFLLVPWASAWYPARYEVDTLGLPYTLRAPEVEQRVAIARGSGYVVRFPIRNVMPVQVILQGADGTVLPPGLAATIDGVQAGVVGWDGLLYLEDPAPGARIEVRLPDGSYCIAQLRLPDPVPPTPLGPLPCR